MLERSLRQRFVLFAIAAAVAVAAGAGYAAFSRHRLPGADAASVAAPPVTSLSPLPQVMFRTTTLGAAYGRIGLAPLAQPNGPAQHAELRCDRLHFAAGRGICLAANRGVITTYGAYLFDEAFRVRHEIPLTGIPSRARVSPDGRLGAFTIFVSGDSYESAGYSTRTFIVDMAAGRPLGHLEEFTVFRDGQPFKAIDFNFWGVTFARDGNRFYATLGTGGRTYLVAGDVDARTARVVTAGIECPSLSPDNTRIAFKRRLGRGAAPARLHVLALDTLAVTATAETRPVDDQVEWLDDSRLLYALPHGAGSSTIWTARADGTGTPEPLRVDAYSPTVIR